MGSLKAAKVISILLVIGIAVLLYTGIIITIFTSENFYLSEFEKVGTYSNFEDRDIPPRLAKGLANYFRDSSIQSPNLPEFTTSELLHLQDVKLIVLCLKSMFYISLALILFCLILLLSFFRGAFARNLQALMKRSGIVVIAIAVLLAILALSFSASFSMFHQIFFPQGNYEFSSDSTLIRLFPERFFLDAFLAILMRAGFFGILLLGIGIALTHARKQKGL